MTSQQLKTFFEVGKCLNYRIAAENLYVTQPAVTKQINALEKELGFLLLVRNKKNVALTPAGELFFRFAKRVSDDYNLTLNECRQLQFNNTIEICCEISFRSKIITESTSRFIQKYPQSGVRFEYCDTSDILNAINKKSYDIFISHINRLSEVVPDLASEPLEIKVFGFLAKKGYMGVTSQPKKACEYDGCDFIDPISKPLYSDDLSKYFFLPIDQRLKMVNDLGLHPARLESKNNWQSVIAAAELGLGVTMVDKDIYVENPRDFFWIKTNKKPQLTAFWYRYNTKPELKYFLEILNAVKEEQSSHLQQT